MEPHPRPRVATGQQIGAGWTPALSVVKALAALAEARRIGGEAVYWLADEDHDRLEVASTVALDGDRILRHRFAFDAPPNTAAGWLPWGAVQQVQAEALWGPLPRPGDPSLRGHALALGEPLWNLGLKPFSPTDPSRRKAIQEELERWRSLDLERTLLERAQDLEAAGVAFGLDPSQQAAWFSLDPLTGIRKRLGTGESCPPGCWLSPGAALRPLMQTLLLPGLEAVVLGPGERAYWRLTEPCWDRVGMRPPRILPRPTVHVVPAGLGLTGALLDTLRLGRWEELAEGEAGRLPSHSIAAKADPRWEPALASRFEREVARTRQRLARLDRRAWRDTAARVLGMDPERLRQRIFPLGRPQERVLPGLFWLRSPGLLERMLDGLRETMGTGGDTLVLEDA